MSEQSKSIDIKIGGVRVLITYVVDPPTLIAIDELIAELEQRKSATHAARTSDRDTRHEVAL